MKNSKILSTLILGSSILLFTACEKSSDTFKEDAVINVPAKKESSDAQILSTHWNGDASIGSSIWKTTNIDGSGTITTPSDSKYGTIWKFYKPAGSHRTESHAAAGFTASEGDDIYIGWHSKLDMPANIQSNAVFQWKAYSYNPAVEPMTQNYPIVFKTTSAGNLDLMHFAPGKIGTVVWSIPLSRNTWNDFVLRLKVSRNGTVGFMEFWYNGVKQDLTGGTQRYYARTLDADFCDPKWGAYGADATTITNYVSGLRIASSYREAAHQVTLYQNVNYGGWNASLSIGDYTSAQLVALGFTNDDASSIRVPVGLKATIYENNNFGGTSAVVTSDNSNLGTISFNDKISSVKITYN